MPVVMPTGQSPPLTNIPPTNVWAIQPRYHMSIMAYLLGSRHFEASLPARVYLYKCKFSYNLHSSYIMVTLHLTCLLQGRYLWESRAGRFPVFMDVSLISFRIRTLGLAARPKLPVRGLEG